MSKISIYGNIRPERIPLILGEFLEEFPEGRTRNRNAVIYGPVEPDPDTPYVAVYRTVGGTIVIRECN